MTEPVAYIQIKDGKAYSVLRKGTPNDDYTPVYTAEQLRPHVKMTQAEFDEWEELFSVAYQEKLGIITLLELISDSHSGKAKYAKLAKRIYNDTYFVFVANKQKELVELLTNYNPEKPEETIEIVPDMKWFVEKKKFDDDYKFLKINEKDLHYNHLKEQATQFDTKEEAELWTNPLTEAVQLPVEE